MATKGSKVNNNQQQKNSILAVTAITHLVYSGLDTPFPAPNDELRHSFTPQSFESNAWKQYDIIGLKGNAFITEVMNFLAECYKSKGNDHPYLVAIRDYCYGHRYFEQKYLKFRTSNNPQVRSMDSIMNQITNGFCSDATSDKVKAKEIAELCSAFLAMLFINSTFVTRTQIKSEGFRELIRKVATEGLFDSSPEFRNELNNIVEKILTVQPKKGGSKSKASPTPTDNDNQKQSSQSTQITNLLDHVGSSISDDVNDIA